MKSKYIAKAKSAVFILCCMLSISMIKWFSNEPVIAYADSPGSRLSYKIELENGTKFFYMKGFESDDDNDEEFLDLESGLYYTHSLENIYLIEPVISQGKSHARYIYEHALIISEDGIYFANLPWTGFAGFMGIGKAGTAAEFYANGRMIKQYNLSGLTWNRIKFQISVSHIMWEDRTKREFDAQNNTLSVTTLNNKTIVFDLTTGGIVSKSLSGLDIALIIICFIAFAAVIAGIVLKIRKKKRKSMTQKQPEIFD